MNSPQFSRLPRVHCSFRLITLLLWILTKTKVALVFQGRVWFFYIQKFGKITENIKLVMFRKLDSATLCTEHTLMVPTHFVLRAYGALRRDFLFNHTQMYTGFRRD